MKSDCLFCKIASGAIPTNRVHEDEDAVAFRDINPQAPVHVLIIPRKHFSGPAALLDEGDERLAGHLLAVAAQVARKEGLAEEGRGFRMVVNSGPDAGQTVHHMHIHVLGGRGMSWPPG